MSRYDANNPWHAEVNLVFDFYCSSKGCDAQMGLSDVPDWDSTDWEDLCAAVADQAQASGWRLDDSGAYARFVCPACSKGLERRDE